MRKLPFLLALGLAACGDNAGLPDAHVHVDSAAHNDTGHGSDAAVTPDAAVDHVALTGTVNGLAWDDASSTLFLTNDSSDKLQKYTDAAGIQDVATLPAAASAMGISLGDVVKRSDGSFLVASLGFNTEGAVFRVPSGSATGAALTGLDVTRKRAGIAQDSTGKLFTSYTTGANTPVGGVALLTVTGTAGTEVPLVTTGVALKHLTGLVANTDALYIADQSQKKILKIAQPGVAVTSLATVTSADLLTQLPNGDLLTGGGTTIERVTKTGVVTTLPGTFTNVAGLAYDPTGARLFFVDHATGGDVLHILPLAN